MKALNFISPIALVILLGITVYRELEPRSPAPGPAPAPSTAPDPVAVKLGSDYARALAHAAADTLEASANRSWNTTAEAAQQNLTDFDDRLAKAWKPCASEMTRRFGDTTDQPIDFAKAAEIRKFWHDLAQGMRKAGAS